MNFSERLRKARQDAKVSQETAANHINVQRPSYTQYESGRTEPSLSNIARLAELYGVSADFLLGLTDDPKPMSKVDLLTTDMKVDDEAVTVQHYQMETDELQIRVEKAVKKILEAQSKANKNNEDREK